MPETLQNWFTREILAHDVALTRYLRRVWPNPHDIHDLRQEIYIRVFESAQRALPAAPRAFLYATARNLMIDRMNRGRVIFIGARGDLDALGVLIDSVSPERQAIGNQELSRLALAFDRLPPKCRSVMWMRKVEQLSQKEIARRLGIREKAVEKQISRGTRLLGVALSSENHDSDLRDAIHRTDEDSEHG